MDWIQRIIPIGFEFWIDPHWIAWKNYDHFFLNTQKAIQGGLNWIGPDLRLNNQPFRWLLTISDGIETGWVTEADAVAGGFSIEPEGNPRQDDDEDARNVDLDEEVALLPPHVETHLQRRIPDCNTNNNSAFIFRVALSPIPQLDSIRLNKKASAHEKWTADESAPPFKAIEFIPSGRGLPCLRDMVALR